MKVRYVSQWYIFTYFGQGSLLVTILTSFDLSRTSNQKSYVICEEFDFKRVLTWETTHLQHPFKMDNEVVDLAK